MTRLFSVFAGAAVATLLVIPAFAQTPTTSGATSSSMTNVYPTSVPIGSNGQVATDPAGYSPYNTNATINNHGIPRQAPPLSLPSIYGLNPCSTGATLGVTTPLVGVGGAISSSDPACEARNNAALAISAFHNEFLAREVLCVRKDWREAWAKIGKPCLEDQRRAGTAPAVADSAPQKGFFDRLFSGDTPAHTDQAAATPAPAARPVGQMMMPNAMPPQAATHNQAVAAKWAQPEWCEHVSASEWTPGKRRACHVG
ncbi:MAG TPA: hypothetical protein VHO91_05285 [Rhodopila sp.]|nr:hypothetical protein [Rhodopila sp.]